MAASLPAEHRPAPRLWRVLAIAALIPLALITIALWLTSNFDSLLKGQHDIEQAYRREIAIAALISEIKDAETGQRGYVITGNPSFLAPYMDARERVGAKMAQVDRLFATQSADVRGHVSRLRALVPRKFVEMQLVLDARESRGVDAAAAIVAAGNGKRLMDDIRTEVAAIEVHQNGDLARVVAQGIARTEYGRRAYLIGVSLVTLIAFLAAYFIWHGRRSRYVAMQEALNHSARQDAIFNSAINAIVLINPSGSIEIMNPAAERLFGHSATHLLRRDIATIVNIAPGEGPFLDRLGLGPNGLAEPFRPLLPARTANGETVPVEVALGLMPLEDGMHIVAVFGDVSEREKVERIKDQFLSTVSHELRTPLTSIVGSLGLLRAGTFESLSDQSKRLVTIAENNANRLIRIVNDLLDAEKLQSGEMEFAMAPIDMRDVVAGSVEGMGGLAETHGVTLRFEPGPDPVMVHGDSDRLVQVVGNLLSNAIKFSPKGEEVVLSALPYGGRCRVAVADRAGGIPLELRDRIFTRFAQATGASTASTPGTGLGLSISRDIVRHHGGNIGFQDNDEGGTTFTFDLPLHGVTPGTTTSFDGLNGQSYLILYTNKSEAGWLTEWFASRSMKTDVVETIPEALAAIHQRRYMAMIVDVQFADGDAPALLQTVRGVPSGRALPVIAIANETLVSDPGDLAALDIVDWLAKPLATEQLGDAVAAAIARAAMDMPLILHVEDDPDTLDITATALSGLARVSHATNLASARAFLDNFQVDIMIVDIALPDGSGLDLVSELSARDGPTPPVIIYSAQDCGASDVREVEAVLTKSKRSLPNLVDTIVAIRDRQDREKHGA
ncbi:CHASE3 domain-containing protein [Sphingobium sufflavum]|uniref:CHASE3 domain-containing protein n=1 Tax=Sphingobium sufflavum TaxID=1129547 RepID=UPI001F346662|nr:CHASE3 domain-containing protein [Sphingobium sufflavum]MCE7796646.1 CHASE3 domain-containing protein [Sphingobium sufflavum]